VVAVGGGTALDTGKLINLLAAQETPAEAIVRGRTPAARAGLPLIAVPTTAGSGSEATHFAVVYADRIKHSVASPLMLPEVSVVDPDLTISASPRQVAVSGMDAFAQAMESSWSIHSTEASRQDARRALQLVLAHLRCAVASPTPRHRRAMSKAAYLAGRAINVTRTTGAHAVSYPLTAHYGVPHGHAVALTLGEFLVYNSRVSDDDVNDPRGTLHVRRVVSELLQMLGCDTPEAGRERIRAMMRAIGLATELSAIGIACSAAADLVAREINLERMSNNPRAVDSNRLGEILDGIR
jgi:alcohol dehydrogenase class IV